MPSSTSWPIRSAEGARAAHRRPPGPAARQLRDRRRRAPLAGGAARRAACHAGHRARADGPGGAELAMIENVQRTDLNPIEEAAATRADRAVRLYPGAARRDHRQEPQPSGQHAAPAEVAASPCRRWCATASSAPATPCAGRPRGRRVARRAHRREGPERPRHRDAGAVKRRRKAGRSPKAQRGADKDADTLAFEKELADAPRPQGRDQARLRRERNALHQLRQLRPARLHPQPPHRPAAVTTALVERGKQAPEVLYWWRRHSFSRLGSAAPSPLSLGNVMSCSRAMIMRVISRVRM